MKAKEVRLLVVDDEPQMIEILEDLFQSLGFVTASASGGESAWAKLEAGDFDIVLSDVRMPQGDGLTLAKKIKARHPTHPKVFFTSGFTDVSIEELYHWGVEGFFAKPFNSLTVRDTITHSLANPEARWACDEAPTAFDLELRGKSVEDLAAHRQGLFGSKGFFAACPKEKSLVLGSRIRFKITFDHGGPPAELIGVGTAKWVSPERGALHGYGIEIVSLVGDGPAAYIKRFGAVASAIPSPRLQSLIP